MSKTGEQRVTIDRPKVKCRLKKGSLGRSVNFFRFSTETLASSRLRSTRISDEWRETRRQLVDQLMRDVPFDRQNSPTPFYPSAPVEISVINEN